MAERQQHHGFKSTQAKGPSSWLRLCLDCRDVSGVFGGLIVFKLILFQSKSSSNAVHVDCAKLSHIPAISQTRAANVAMLQEFWSWRKFWSPGPKFSQENMVRLLKNWSRLKTLILGLLLKQENIKRTVNHRRVGLGNSQRTWRSLKHN